MIRSNARRKQKSERKVAGKACVIVSWVTSRFPYSSQMTGESTLLHVLSYG